jgi:phage shock protein A
MHEKAYNNNVRKIKSAMKKLGDVKTKIQKYDAELKMSRAEAEMSELAKSFDFDVTTDFGQIESVIEDKISLNRGKARVAADLSEEGMVDIEREEAMENVLAEDALRDFEIDLGLVTPQTAGVDEEVKEMGPATKETEG